MTLLGMSVLCEYAIAEYFAYCRILHVFQQSHDDSTTVAAIIIALVERC